MARVSRENAKVYTYIRVSTAMQVDGFSLDAQRMAIKAYADYEGMEIVREYADKGISGTSTKERVEFRRLIQDAEDGKIDYIMAKSISRFARNTVDALSYTRQLKDMGVGVYFEEQDLDTLSATSEIFLTIHAAFAQEESYSLSENMKRGIRNRFALGTPKISTLYGYQLDKDKWCICEEEAEVVREIYRLYVDGYSTAEVCDELNRRGIKPPMESRKEGCEPMWRQKTVGTILSSEKYVGDVEMQKTYTVDCLTAKRVSNKDADIPKYYKKNHHEPIIDRETYRLAHYISAMRDRHNGSVQYPFYGFLKCPICGADMVRCQLPTRGSENAWFCSERCEPYAIKEKYLHKGVMEAYVKIGKTPPGEMVEYKFLYDNVEAISFEKKKDKVNWNKLTVQWKWGERSRAIIAFENPSDIPCTKLDIIDSWVCINGEKMNKCPHTAVCAERIREYVMSLSVDMSGEIPIVKKCNNIAKTADREIV